MKLTGKDFTVTFDDCEIEALIYSNVSLNSGVEVSWAQSTECKELNWMKFDRPTVKVVGGFNYKLMTSKSKVGKRKVLVKLIGETK